MCPASSASLSRAVCGVAAGLAQQRVEAIDQGDDPRAERNRLADEAGRVAAAVPVLVVAEDQRRDRRRERHGVDDVGADLRVQPQLAALVVGQAVALGEDVLRHGQHADVVQHRRGRDGLHLVVAQGRGARQERRVALQTPQVQPRALVGGVDGQRQRLDGREVQVGQPLHGQLLLIHPLDVGAIGAVAEPQREGAERRQP